MSATPSKKPKIAPVQSATLLNFFRPKPSVKELTATQPASSSCFAPSAEPTSSVSARPSSSTFAPREEKKAPALSADGDGAVESEFHEGSSTSSSSSSSSFRASSTSCSFSSSISTSSSASVERPPLATKSVSSTVTAPSPYSSSTSSSSWDALPTSKSSRDAPPTSTSSSWDTLPTSKSSASSSRDAPPTSKSSASSTWDELPTSKSSASSSSWDALPTSKSSASSAPKPSPYASAATSSSWDSLPKSSTSSLSKPSVPSVKPSYSKVVPSYAPVSGGSSEASAPNRYVAEIAKSGRATCRDFKCKQKIDKSELRIGKVTPNYFHEGSDDVMTQWFHPPCIFSALARAKSTTKKIESVDDIEGFEGLSEMHQNWIRDLLVQNAGMMKPPPAMKAKSSISSSSASSSGGSSSGGSSGVSWEFNKDGSWFLMAAEDSKMLEDHYAKGEYYFTTKDISFNKVHQTLYAFQLNGANPMQINTASGTSSPLRRVVKPSAPVPTLVKAKSALKTTAPPSAEVSTGWEWFNKDRWTPFAAEDADMLESRFKSSDFVFETKKLSFNLAYGTNYKFVLNGSKPTQANCSTGTITPIRRLAPPSSAAEEEEDWWGDDDQTAATTAEPEEEEEDDSGPAVWWEWSNMGSWEKFTPKDSKMLENKWKNGELIFCHVISYGGRAHEMYKFNLCGPNPTQRNTETGLTRSLRRRKAGVVAPLSAPKEEADHCWHWLNKTVWTHFMPEDSKMLEEKFQTGNLTFETKDLAFNKGFTTVYRFNLGGSNPTQKNLESGAVTPLRRALLSKKEAPSSPPKKSSPVKSSAGEKQVKKSEAHWEWSKGGVWIPYEGSDNHMLEAKYQGKDFLFVTSKLSFNMGFSTEYRFALSGDEPSQTNLKTKTVTPIRRVGASSASTKIDDDDWW